MSQAARANDATDTTLRGPWLVAAWVAWIAIATLAIVYFVAVERFAYLELWDAQRRVIIFAVTIPQLLVFGVSAAVILRRKYDDWVALLVALTLVTTITSFIDPEEPAFLAANSGWAIPAIFATLTLTTPLFLLFFVFPDGRFVPRWSGAVLLLWPPVVLIMLLPSLGDPEALDRSRINTAWLGFAAFGMLCQAYRYWCVSNVAERQQTKWVVLGLAGLISGGLVWIVGVFALPPVSGTPGPIDAVATTSFGTLGRPLEMTAGVLMFGLPLAFPISLVFSILRYRLWDIDVVLNRALVYGVLTAALAGTYFGGVVLLQMAFRGVTGQGNAVAVVISTLAIAALFVPLRLRVQSFIDRRFYRRRYDAALPLAAFADRMRDEVDVDKLTGELVDIVDDTMQPSHASLWLRAGTSTSGSRSHG